MHLSRVSRDVLTAVSMYACAPNDTPIYVRTAREAICNTLIAIGSDYRLEEASWVKGMALQDDSGGLLVERSDVRQHSPSPGLPLAPISALPKTSLQQVSQSVHVLTD